jgi:folate-binding Fe-S cluster repair protein YgfZ
MGQAPRKLLLLKTKVESGGVQLSVPAELRSEGHPCGTITSAIRNDDNTVTALAVVTKTFLEKQNFSALGQTFFRTN